MGFSKLPARGLAPWPAFSRPSLRPSLLPPVPALPRHHGTRVRHGIHDQKPLSATIHGHGTSGRWPGHVVAPRTAGERE
jgi:hypothetical protein